MRDQGSGIGNRGLGIRNPYVVSGFSRTCQRPVRCWSLYRLDHCTGLSDATSNAAAGCWAAATEATVTLQKTTQLGLKLEAARGPVDVLVIDSVERPTPD